MGLYWKRRQPKPEGDFPALTLRNEGPNSFRSLYSVLKRTGDPHNMAATLSASTNSGNNAFKVTMLLNGASDGY